MSDKVASKVMVKFEMELDESFLGDVMVTAFDGMYGGCWYWAAPGKDDWLEKQTIESNGHDMEEGWSKAYITWGPEGGPGGQQDAILANGKWVGWETLKTGIQYLLNGKDAYGHEVFLDDLLQAVCTQDAGMIDSSGADIIVQLGLLGQVVFG